MPKFTEKIDTYTLPVAALDGTVLFPGIPISLELSSEGTICACERAVREGGRAFFSLRRVSDDEAVRSAMSEGFLVSALAASRASFRAAVFSS